MKPTIRRAFTLVELLVVIAIIGILISLMLPAIQACRETARRAQCVHHMAQLGLALQNYEAAHEVLPPGVVDTAGPIRGTPAGYHMSWIVQLLPYIEENVAYRKIDFAVGAYDKKNARVREIGIGLLICPSESRGFGGTGRRTSNYAACHHDVESPIDKDNHGVFFLNSALRSRELPDGASHTIYVGEKRAHAWDFGWVSGTRSTLRNTGAPINDTMDWTLKAWGTSAATPTWTVPEQDAFGESLPEDHDLVPADRSDELKVGGFGSSHSGVANFVFGDGAVRTLSQVIDFGLFQQLGHRADGKLIKAPLP